MKRKFPDPKKNPGSAVTDRMFAQLRGIGDWLGVKPPFITPKEEKARAQMERHPWFGRRAAKKYAGAHPGQQEWMLEMWKSYATLYQQTANLPFLVWDENRRFSYGDHEHRKTAVSYSRDYFLALKEQFWEATGFLHSAKLVSPDDRKRHWTPPTASYEEVRAFSERRGRKGSPFFSTFRKSDLETIYRITSELEARDFIYHGPSDRTIRMGFPIGFTYGRETDLLVLKVNNLNFHGYPADDFKTDAPMLEFDKTDLGSYSEPIAELRTRCLKFAGRM